jgi:hypothetical protein
MIQCLLMEPASRNGKNMLNNKDKLEIIEGVFQEYVRRGVTPKVRYGIDDMVRIIRKRIDEPEFAYGAAIEQGEKHEQRF